MTMGCRRIAHAGLATVVLMGAMGADCTNVIPIPPPQFLKLEPVELQASGFCQDWGPGAVFHENETCFRRENCIFDCPQVCVDGDGNSTDSRDTISPVLGTAPNGRCLYDVPWDPIGGILAHPLSLGHIVFDVVPSMLGIEQ